ncbi:Blue-light photoreceptor PHR2 [Gracilariopsis chorda]|uniref:Blue-light photoreceptor PHR2 n=1 Tax=Gracilariopsis chorda TaxID=448386 RepID=A0A2V3IZ79_9FLOR|nr:Blue-light photoreceptor PHR2 [Gracilariopsis chorda]|eukprot:PXF46987.1 Blue-light photoreceptor PHR2 [Gracilariopsis chorda]
MGAFVAPLALGARTHAPTSSVASRSLPLCASPAPFAQCTPLAAANAPHPDAAAPCSQVVVVWFRSDLRLHDNPCLTGIEDCVVAPLLVLGENAQQASLDAAHDLRDALRRRGCELFVRRAARDVVAAVSHFCSTVRADRLHFSAGVSREQRVLEQRVRREVAAMGTDVTTFWSGGLFSPEQLPFAVQDMPQDCDAFANAVRTVRVDEPLPVPDSFRPVSGVQPGHIPGCIKGCGGEKVALCGLDEYCSGALAKVDGGKLRTSFGGRLEPFLKMGCISPRLLWKRVVADGENSLRRYCAEIELMLLEFRRFMMLKNGVLPA